MTTLKPGLRQKRWKLAPTAPPEFLATFPEHPRIISQLLFNRGITTDAAASEFLNPVYTRDLHDPNVLGGIPEAVKTITEAISSKQKITIHGDYDADGVTSTALLLDALTQLGANVDTFIPDRYVDGYGVSKSTLLKLREQGTHLVITVDCGISSAGPIATARAQGLQVVVTDHHTPPSDLPKGEAVINPHLPGDPYPNKALTGVGVAFKLAQALIATTKWPPERQEAAEKWLLDLVAIGTVADVASLTDENRTLVKFGLVVLNKTRRPGLRHLIELAGCAGAVDTGRVGFAIAPRLNAAGRLTHAGTALELLTTNDTARAAALAAELNTLNDDRRSLTETAYLEAKQQLRNVTNDHRILVVDGDWKSGIVGLLAGRLTEEYSRPVLAIERGPETARGSARSIEGFNITETLAAHAHLLDTYGGHAGAAGFSLSSTDVPKLRKALQAFALTALRSGDLIPIRRLEAEIKPSELTLDLVKHIGDFAPFGVDNPEPEFLLKDATVRTSRCVGDENRHLKLELDLPDGRTLPAIAFGCGDQLDAVRRSRTIDLAGYPTANTFGTSTNLEWHVRDFRLRD